MRNKKGQFVKGGVSWFKGKKHSEESKEKNRQAHLGKKMSDSMKKKTSERMKGKKLPEWWKEKMRKPKTEEARINMSRSQIESFKNGREPSRGFLGKHHTKEIIRRLRKINKGRTSPMKGKTHSEEARSKISIAQKGRKASEKTKIKMRKRRWSQEMKRRMSLSHGGTGIPQRTNKRYYHKIDSRYREWREKVFKRDNWTCQECGARSKRGKKVYIEPHHIKGWAKYPKLRYILNNGITLCYSCHQLTKKSYVKNHKNKLNEK